MPRPVREGPIPAGLVGKKCASCGNQANKYSSGILECWECWNWRKLDRAAAKYWVEAVDYVFAHDGGSGPDLIDIEQWEEWGIVDEMIFALWMLKDIRDRYAEALEKHGVKAHAEVDS